MKETIICDNCTELIDITHLLDEYYTTAEEETFDIIKCEKCKTINSIFWQSDVTFSSTTASEEDIETFK